MLRGLETRWLTGRDRDRNQHPTQGPPEFQGVPGQEFVKSLQDPMRNPPDIRNGGANLEVLDSEPIW
ncbi:hypothetical protein [Thermus sp.]|uniref:hypothetical protein n=1 Tax=Thermus sp. TaxID=275 RepID=UPI0039194D5A